MKIRRNHKKKCSFKDVKGFKNSSKSTIVSSELMWKWRGSWGKFPQDHALNKVLRQDEGAIWILKNSVFREEIGVDCENFVQEVKKKPIFDELIVLFKKIVFRHHQFLNSSKYQSRNLNDPACIKILSPKDVYCTVQKAVWKVFPKRILTSNNNWTNIFKNVKHLIYNGFAGFLCMDDLMSGIKQSDVKWLYSLRCNGERRRILALILHWMISHWVLPFIMSFWRAVDTSEGLQFYDKRYWQSLEDRHYYLMIKSGKIKLSTDDYFSQTKLQFLPKGSGSVRPILIPMRYCSVSSELRPNLTKISPDFFKSAIKKYPWRVKHQGTFREVAQTLEEIRELKNQNVLSTLYFVKVDINDAFGSVNHKKLFEILRKVLRTLAPDDGKVTMRTYDDDISHHNGFYKTCVRFKFRGDESYDPVPQGYMPCKKEDEEIDVENVIRLLEASVNQFVINFGKKKHVLTEGIGQGVQSSSFLCEIYYRDMIDTHLADFVLGENKYLLRYVDDILFLTTNRSEANRFLINFQRGFRDYNCWINPSKTSTNICDPKNTCELSYLGSSINIKECTMTAVFDRHLKHRVGCWTYDRFRKAYRLVKPKKIFQNCVSIRSTKIEPWFMNLNLNGKENVLANVRKGANFLGQKLINTEVIVGHRRKLRQKIGIIRITVKKIVICSRRIFNKQSPALRESVQDREIMLAAYEGYLKAFAGLIKWNAVSKYIKGVIKRIKELLEEDAKK